MNVGCNRMKDQSHDTAMVKSFRADPAYAKELLAEVRRDGNSHQLAILLRQMDEAFGSDRKYLESVMSQK